MRIDALTLKQLRALLAVAETGSITLGAGRLNQTPPTIHSQIKNLESLVGQSLLARASDGTGFHATDAGQEIVIAAERIEAVLSHAAHQIDALSQGKTGHVVLGIVSTAKYFAPRLVRLLQERLPDVEITLRDNNRQETIAALDRGEFDLVIMGRPPRHAISRSVPLGPNPHGIVLPPDHPLAAQDGYDPSALLQQTFISREDGSGTRILMQRFIDRLGEGRAPKIVVMPSNETIKQAVLAGLGIAFLSLHTVHDEVEAGRLVLLRGTDLPVMRHWYLVPGTADATEISMATKRCAEEIEALGGVYLPKFTA